MDHELGITKLFNDYLPGPANAVLSLVGLHPEERPWGNWITCEILVVLLIVVVFGLLRSRISMDKPGKLQHLVEVI